MRLTFPILTLAAALASGTAIAQTTITGQPAQGGTSAGSGGQQAVTRPNTDTMTRGNQPTLASMASAKLEPGANSFTEGQVKSRLEEAGFSGVTELRKDDQGIWRGKATHSGRTMTIGFDFKGNVSAQ